MYFLPVCHISLTPYIQYHYMGAITKNNCMFPWKTNSTLYFTLYTVLLHTRRKKKEDKFIPNNIK